MDEIVPVYTYSQAIDAGLLHDVSKLADEFGIWSGTAITAAVWAECVAVPDACPWQDETERLGDVLKRLGAVIRRIRGAGEFVVMVQNDERGPKAVTLKAVYGRDEYDEQVITVMFPGENQKFREGWEPHRFAPNGKQGSEASDD